MSGLPPFPMNAAVALADAPEGLAFRRAGERHLPFLRSLYAETRADELARIPWSVDVRRQFLDSQFDLQHTHYITHYPDASYMIVEERDQSIGRLYLDERASDLHIVDISVLREVQGKGWGTSIVRGLMARATQARQGVSLQVSRFNPRAQALYRRLGFLVTAESDTHLSMRWVS